MELIVNIDVDDLDRGVAFYEQGLGMVLMRRLFQDTVAEMELGKTRVYLVENMPGSNAVPGKPIHRRYERHWTPVHLDFSVNDIVLSVERALSAGAKQEGQIQSFPWGLLARLSDPFGHGFCFVQFENGGYRNEE